MTTPKHVFAANLASYIPWKTEIRSRLFVDTNYPNLALAVLDYLGDFYCSKFKVNVTPDKTHRNKCVLTIKNKTWNSPLEINLDSETDSIDDLVTGCLYKETSKGDTIIDKFLKKKNIDDYDSSEVIVDVTEERLAI
ncbi:MAG: hypothetical protein WA056_02415 [Gallionella sp.]